MSGIKERRGKGKSRKIKMSINTGRRKPQLNVDDHLSVTLTEGMGEGHYAETVSKINYPNRLETWSPAISQAMDIAKVDKAVILGGGEYGLALAISDDRVLKITTQNGEFRKAEHLIEKDHNHLVKIYQRNSIGTIGSTFYILIMERLRLPTPYEFKALSWMDKRVRGWRRAITDQLKERYRNEINNDKLLTKKQKKLVYRILTQVQAAHKEARELGIELTDIHRRNVGFRPDGKIVVFDIQ